VTEQGNQVEKTTLTSHETELLLDDLPSGAELAAIDRQDRGVVLAHQRGEK